jgi:hypothetical protein
LRERGWASPNLNERTITCGILQVYMYFVTLCQYNKCTVPEMSDDGVLMFHGLLEACVLDRALC